MIMARRLRGGWRARSAGSRTVAAMKLSPLVPLLALALFACGGDDSEPAAKATPPATATASPAASGGEEDVREMFADYTEALRERDWEEACEHLAPETTDKLKSNVAQLGLADAPGDCEGLMGALYEQIDQNATAKKTIDDITASAKVTDVEIDGDTASVSWSATVNGTDTPVTQSARIVDGEWKLIDVN
jgi:hypothetical protein